MAKALRDASAALGSVSCSTAGLAFRIVAAGATCLLSVASSLRVYSAVLLYVPSRTTPCLYVQPLHDSPTACLKQMALSLRYARILSKRSDGSGASRGLFPQIETCV